MGARATRAKFEPIRTIAAADITEGYVQVGGILVNPAREFLCQNLTDAMLMFSTDGIHDHFELPPNAYYVNDVTTNRNHDDGLFLPTGSGLWVKQTGTPTTGKVNFTVMFGSEL